MNEESPPPSSLPPQFPHHVTRLIHQDHCRWQKGYQWTPPFFLSFFFFYLVAGGVVLRFWMTGNRESRETRRRGEREKGWMRVTLKAERKVIESPLYVHWADKQVAEYIMSMNEKEGTRSLSVPLHLFDTPPSHVLVSLFWVRVKQWLLILMLT